MRINMRSRRRRTNPIATGCLFAFVGTIFAVIGIFMLMDSARFLPGTVSANGTIVACSFTKNTCKPTVSFMTQAGQQITFQSSFSSSSFHEGDVVPVKYHLNTPQDGRIDDWMTQLFPFAFAGLGSFFVLLGLFIFLRGLIRRSMGITSFR